MGHKPTGQLGGSFGLGWTGSCSNGQLQGHSFTSSVFYLSKQVMWLSQIQGMGKESPSLDGRSYKVMDIQRGRVLGHFYNPSTIIGAIYSAGTINVIYYYYGWPVINPEPSDHQYITYYWIWVDDEC